MPVRFYIRDELKSFISSTRMKQYRKDWPILMDSLRRLWEIGEETKLVTPFIVRKQETP
jgi:hypothetical protein